MSYSLLTDEMRLELLRERVLELEAQHFRGVLRRMEAEHLGDLAERAEIDRRLNELARRIERHVGLTAPAGDAADRQPDVDQPDNHGENATHSIESAAQRNGHAVPAAP